jgi:hypothetical protein
MQMALCYLEAICTKIPELVEKEKIGDGVQGEPDLSPCFHPDSLFYMYFLISTILSQSTLPFVFCCTIPVQYQ